MVGQCVVVARLPESTFAATPPHGPPSAAQQFPADHCPALTSLADCQPSDTATGRPTTFRHGHQPAHHLPARWLAAHAFRPMIFQPTTLPQTGALKSVPTLPPIRSALMVGRAVSRRLSSLDAVRPAMKTIARAGGVQVVLQSPLLHAALQASSSGASRREAQGSLTPLASSGRPVPTSKAWCARRHGARIGRPAQARGWSMRAETLAANCVCVRPCREPPRGSSARPRSQVGPDTAKRRRLRPHRTVLAALPLPQ